MTRARIVSGGATPDAGIFWSRDPLSRHALGANEKFGGSIQMEGSRDSRVSVTRVASRLAERDALERVVSELQEMKRQTGLRATLAVGELVLTEFFGANPAAWQDRRKNKNNSIRRLAGHRDCPYSRSALDLAVTVYVATHSMPCARTFGHIGASHIAAVLGLPESERIAMLEAAERERLSVRELRHRVVSLRRVEGEKRGRPPLESSAKALGLLRNALARVKQAAELLNERGEPDGDMRAECTEVATELEVVCSELLSTARPARSVVRVAAGSEGREVLARQAG